MLHKNNAFTIDENNIFKHDKLKREEAIKNLSSLINATDEAFTMSINADWGAGKTTFIKLWQAYLKKEHQIKSIYFSAWEDDFSKEPLISIIGEINSYVSENYKEKQITDKMKKVVDISSKVLKRGVPAFIKGATMGALEIDKGFESAIGAISESTAKELIEKYTGDKKITDSFHDAIADLLSHIGKDKPFVVFIDELDRCRPIYAIELLERVKHIFGIDSLIFVLSIDKKQLSASIKSQYGDIDTNSYLKRFIDLEYNLPDPDKNDFCEFLYQDYKVEEIIRSKNISDTYRDLDHLEMLKYLVKSLGLSLREIEQVFIQIGIVFRTIKPRLFESHFRVFIFLISLKVKNNDLYLDIIRKRKSDDELIQSITNDKIDKFYTIIRSLVYATNSSLEKLNQITEDEKRNLIPIRDKHGEFSEEAQEQEWLVNLLEADYSTDYSRYRLNELIDNAIQKVDFIDRFNLE